MHAVFRRLGPVTAAFAAVLAITACGGSTVSRKDVIARADRICSTALTRLRTVTPPSRAPAALTSMSAYVGRILPIVDTELAQLRKLPQPDSGGRLLRAYIRSVATTAGQYRALARAAASGEQDRVDTALTTLSTSSAGSDAAAFGLTTCASAAGAAIS